MSPLSALHPTAAAAGVPSAVLQRKCACGQPASGLAGECEDCQREQALGLRPKRVVGAADDPYEQEAVVAAQVLRMSTPPRLSAAPLRIIRRRPLHSALPGLGSAPTSVHAALRSPGEPLPPATRAFFEPRFSHDFGRVRVHRDAQAATSARALAAQAYTHGEHLVFAAGRYAPESAAGRRLLAHELAHVVQQGSAGAMADVLRRAPEEPSALGLHSAALEVTTDPENRDHNVISVAPRTRARSGSARRFRATCW